MRKAWPLFAVLLLLLPGSAAGQCLLGNPSFELAGSGGAAFGVWNQFGPVAAAPGGSHGSTAAQVDGPNQNIWAVSAVWQRLDTAPGDTWSASVCVNPQSILPLTGESTAILNIEWRDNADNLISYESHTIADASTPHDEYTAFQVVSQPAPAGAVATHLLVGVLQSPNDPTPRVLLDQATFEKTGPPTPDDLQWGDFPGGRTVFFSGRTWRVKGPGYYGPGPNLFCDESYCTWVDAQGRLHLTIQDIQGSVYSTEVVLEQALGYGDYIFTTEGRIDNLHPNAVFGMFVWEYRACYPPEDTWWGPYNEFDIEFSRWGNPANPAAQFVAQPYDYPGNLSSFDAVIDEGEITSHAFRWLPDRVECRSWRGGPDDEATTSAVIHQWTYTGPHLPRPERPRVHLNLWYAGTPPDSYQEVVLTSFTFVPAAGGHNDGSQVGLPDVPPRTVFSRAAPNPLSGATQISFYLERGGPVALSIHDAAGRLVKSLADEDVVAGEHRRWWDGTDQAGRPVGGGVYFYRLRTPDAVETRSLVLVR